MKIIMLSLALIGGSSLLGSCCTGSAYKVPKQDGVKYDDCGGLSKIVNVILG